MDNNFKLIPPETLKRINEQLIYRNPIDETIQNLQPNPSLPELNKVEAKVVIEPPPPRKGFEGWYDRNIGKITVILGLIAIIEGFIIFLLSE